MSPPHEFKPIDATARTVALAAIESILKAHPDYDAAQACARMVADMLRSGVFLNVDTTDWKSRPKW